MATSHAIDEPSWLVTPWCMGRRRGGGTPLNKSAGTVRVVEFAVGNGLGYGVVTSRDSTLGDLIYVFDTIWDERPRVLDQVLDGTVVIVGYTVLSAAIRRKLASIVGTVAARGLLLEQPAFRTNVGTTEEPVWRLRTPSGPEGRRLGKDELKDYPVLRTVTIPWLAATLMGDLPADVALRV